MASNELKGTYWGVPGAKSLCGFGGSCSKAQKPHAGDDVGPGSWRGTGTPAYALTDGVVWRSRNGGVSGYQQEITIKYDVRNVSRYVDYVYVLYGHCLKDSLLAVGSKVVRGQTIAKIGTSGDAMDTTPHFHIEVWADEMSARNYTNWRAIDPAHIRKALEPVIVPEKIEREPSKNQLIKYGSVPSAVPEPDVHMYPAYAGNYQKANRDSDDVWLILMHQTQSNQGDQGHGDASWFANPAAGTAAHYIVGSNGHIDKCVRVRDIAYHAGNWGVNQGSVGIEIDGWTNKADTPEAQYRSAAKLFRFLCGYFDIPMQLGFDTENPRKRIIKRAGMIGHEHVPGATHTDPGTGFDYEKILTMARSM